MKLFQRAAAGALAAALLFTGCAAGQNAWVYRAEEQQIPAGLYIYYLISAASTATNKVNEAHQGEEGYTVPAYKDLLKSETVEGQQAGAYIRSEADRLTREHLAVEQQFAQQGLALTDIEASYVDTSTASNWSGNQEFFEKNGIAESSLRMAFENSFKRQALFNAAYGPEGTSPVTDDELKALFETNYAKADLMLVPAGGTDSAAQKEAAEAYLKRLQDGENIYDLIFEQEKAEAAKAAEAAAAAATDSSSAPEIPEPTKPEEGSRAILVSEADKGVYYSDKLVDAALAAVVDAPVLVDDGSYFYLLVRRNILVDESDFTANRERLLQDLKKDEFDQTIQDWASALAIETQSSALNRYTPEWITVAQ